MQDLPDHRQFQHEAIDRLRKRARALQCLNKGKYCTGNGDTDVETIGGNEARGVDQQLGDRRQFGTKALEQFLELPPPEPPHPAADSFPPPHPPLPVHHYFLIYSFFACFFLSVYIPFFPFSLSH